MSRRSFTVRANWDPEAGVFYSESDIIGLHVEARTLEEFEEVLFDVASELVIANHLTPEELATKPLKDIVPAIVWERPRQVA